MKLKRQAKDNNAIIRSRGETRGWDYKSSGSWNADEETRIGGLVVWQFIKGGKFQPLVKRAST